MNKYLINKFCRKFGFEIHGLGFIQSISKFEFNDDPFEKQKSIINLEPKIIFDLGANRGDTVAKYLTLFPNAKIYAFEPYPPSFLKLYDRFKDYPNIFIYQLAISDKVGEVLLFNNFNEDTNSLLASSKIGLSSDSQVKNIDKISVKSDTIDNFCFNNKILNIDILKMDIQGSELSVLSRATNMLNNKKIGLIYTEVYFKPQYVNQPLFHNILIYLEKYNYHLQDFYSPIYGKGMIVWADAIFL